MTDSELQRLENALGVTLPAQYVEIMRTFPVELQRWPAWAEAEGSQTFYSDVDVILDVNAKVRQNPGQFVKFPKELRTAWPKNLFVFGRYNDESLYLIDVDERDPPVQSLCNGAIRPSFPDLASLYRSFQYRHGASWKEDRKRSKKPKKRPKATLPAADLLAEGRYLARSAVVLSAEGSEYVANWRGTGVVPSPQGQWQHWVSFDAGALPDNPRKRRGVLSVYLCTEEGHRFDQVTVAHDNAAKLPRMTDGEPLYAHRVTCLPPVDAIFRFGRNPIQTWLSTNDGMQNGASMPIFRIQRP